MMGLISLGSSSKGNCHILYNGISSIMLDCGINMNKYNYDIQKYNISGILVSHNHLDHCKGLKEKTYLGNQNVYANHDTLEFLGDSVMDYRKKEINELKLYKIDDYWSIVPIRVLHDVDCFGYIIKEKTTNLKIAYFTDLGYSENLKINGINIWIIECNHIRKEVELSRDKAIEEENSNVAYFNRVLSDSGHLSLEDSCNMIKNNYNKGGTKDIILCHISSGEDDFERYEKLYQDELKSLGIEFKKPHAINNKIKEIEIYDIVPKNEWEDIELE